VHGAALDEVDQRSGVERDRPATDGV
jgi:hypothetical protein